MVDQSVISDWWEQLGMDERIALLYFSAPEMSDTDKAVVKVGAGAIADGTYRSYSREIQEIVEKAFLDGREGNEYWFGVEWTFDCPNCGKHSDEKGSIRFRSWDSRAVRTYLVTQGAKCMNCGKAPPSELEIKVGIFRAPLVVLWITGYAVPGPNSDISNGARYLDAWVKAGYPKSDL